MQKLYFAASLATAAIAGTTAEWKSKSVYQILTDRFAKSTTGGSACTSLSYYCGGTFLGIKNNLSYIKGMGFDAIWISPVVENSANGYHGYWALNWNNINPQFGTAQQLKDLVAAAHALGIWVMVDVVANHVAPIGTNYGSVTPFNQSYHYHSTCQITDFNNQSQVENCRLANLPDLDQSNSYVRTTLKDWVKNLVTTYGFDGIRIDTIPEVPKDFWSEFGASAGVFQMGEVFNGNPAYVGPYQNYVTGVFNYPMYYTIKDVFGSGQYMGNIKQRYDSSAQYYKDPSVLGLFVDNHDNARFLNTYANKKTQLKNATVFSMTGLGIPFVYYGTEQYYTGGNDPQNRESLWQAMNTSSDFYQIIKKVNAQRKKSAIWNETWVERYAAQNFYAFSRGKFLVALTNSTNTQTYKVTYQPFTDGEAVCNIFYPTTDCQTVSGGVNITLTAGESKIYVPKTMLASTNDVEIQAIEESMTFLQ